MPSIEDDIKLDFKDVLIRPKRSFLSSRAEVSVERSFIFKHSKQEWRGVPIIAANMDTIGTFEVAEVLASKKIITAVHKHYSVDQWKAFVRKHSGQNVGGGKNGNTSPHNSPVRGPISNTASPFLDYIAVSCGIGESDQSKLESILAISPQLKMVCIDVANGYSQRFVDFIKRVRAKYPGKTIIAGNVVTQDMTEELIMSGADIVKVGIGPGSVCTTRKQTGVGYPQLSAVLECADAAHGLSGRVISDGGCTCPGDVAKAVGAGSDFVMLGGMLAGHDECGGEIVEEAGGKKFKVFYGMSSDTAMKKHSGGVAEYRSSEGKTVKVPYRGKLIDTVNDLLGGIRSSCTYVGAKEIRELNKRTTFIRVSQQLNPVFSASDNNPPPPGPSEPKSPGAKRQKV